jgi:hypothetical protein
LFRRNSFASAISVSLFPRERMRDITSERFVLVKMSDIFKSVDLPNLAVKAQPGIEMANDWTREEVEAAVADYFDMLEKEISGIPYSKIDHNRRLQKILVNRSKGSIEFKHQNITAVLIENEFANIPGYKPRFNYQDLLRIVVEDRLVRAKKLQEAAKIAVAKPVETIPVVDDILSILVPAPIRKDEPKKLRDTPRVVRKMLPQNYLEAESRNHSLGRAGEDFILKFEHARLWRAGKRTLADRIEHVAQTQGDSIGYDILSFEETGRERLIEVKTTRYGSMTPFFASRNEVKISEAHHNEYKLYRLFQFNKEPQLFVLNGSLQDTCTLEPNQFSVLPKSAS